MKVSLNHFFNMQSTNNNKGKLQQSSSQNSSVSRTKNCDELIISGKIEKTDETSFVDEIKNKISKEIAAPCSEQKIEDLKQQIQDGTYKIDIDQITKKMLLS
ncbi:flagellar biosynthesis anti-sigma factor FlgM [Anaerotignum sp.]|uniref:flagellar biosynthesis anti-sigma factor FlgM n=1 Tax=Anaerotignum sp. TaxID=2039241 RepID=UPI002714BB15|nr:flagellar biosynthesis anti-sigma factor FlgM [Anaerotignum sp.]